MRYVNKNFFIESAMTRKKIRTADAFISQSA